MIPVLYISIDTQFENPHSFWNLGFKIDVLIINEMAYTAIGN